MGRPTKPVRSRPCPVQGMLTHVLCTLGAASTGVMAYSLLLIIRPAPLWNAQYLIPTYGMVLGNAISAVSLGLSTALEELTTGGWGRLLGRAQLVQHQGHEQTRARPVCGGHVYQQPHSGHRSPMACRGGPPWRVSRVWAPLPWRAPRARAGKDRLELMLGLGASRMEAAKPLIQRTLATALQPVLNQMSTIGLVSIPGMMTGQILGGTSPAQARPPMPLHGVQRWQGVPQPSTVEGLDQALHALPCSGLAWQCAAPVPACLHASMDGCGR